MGVNGRSNLSFDANGFLAAFCNYLQTSLEKMENEFIDIMKEEIDNNTENAGDPDWRKDLKAELKSFNKMITDRFVTSEVGIDEVAASVHTKMVGYVTAYGIGSRATTDGGEGEPIYKGPPGRWVWNSGLDGITRSKQQYAI